MATATNTTRNNGRAGRAAANAGAAAGGFVGGLGSSFVPPVNINVNKGSAKHRGARTGPGGRHGGFKLPEAEFNSPAQVRNYCNSGRALLVGLSFEVDMAAEILQATLAQVPDPDGRKVRSMLRARKVSRQMKRAASDAKAAAKHFAAAYAAFQREYEEEMRRVRHRARPRAQARMDWADI